MYPSASTQSQMFQFMPNQPEMFPSPVKGTVEKTILGNQLGRIKCLGSFWFAKLYQANDINNIPVGKTVDVIGRVGNTLLVMAN
ncbi:MAG: NfeD family protein [Leptolyngbyaceae cyanobacterium MO_188.B28]|nr:NfeD family protein [Leptolyngbyaceae cyanobacterium MO_188.B28]